MIKLLLVYMLSLFLFFMFFQQVQGQMCTSGEKEFLTVLLASEDAYVAWDHEDENYGSAIDLIITARDTFVNSFVQFDLSLLPAGLRPTNASLFVPVDATSGRAAPVLISKNIERFDEDTVTWNTQPHYHRDSPYEVDLLGSPIDTTRLVSQSLLAGEDFIGFGFLATFGIDIFIFSKESLYSRPIRLRLEGCVPISLPCGSKCPSRDKCCNGQCYNPATHVCIDNRLCPVGHLLCGTGCYSPTIYNCINGVLVHK